MRVAVVTPYCQEADSLLLECLSSVRGQSWTACTHFLVADGFPKPLEGAAVRHIVLPTPHGDGGNLARGVGSLAAIAEDFDAVAFLDADNWYKPEHIERLVQLHRRTGASVCSSGRSLHRADGSVMPLADQSDGENFVDTNCLCVFRGGFDVLPLWGMMPSSYGPVGDRVIWHAVRARGATRAHLPEPTVCYRSQHRRHYRLLGEEPPSSAKDGADNLEAHDRFTSLPLADRAALAFGVETGEEIRAAARIHEPSVPSTTLEVGTPDRRLALSIPDVGAVHAAAAEIFRTKCYALPPATAPRSILDIGAHVGLSAAFFRLACPDASLYCIEPNPAAYDYLGRNAEVIGNCLTYRAALFNVSCPAEYYFGPSWGRGSLAAISDRSARILLLDAQRFIARLPQTSFDLIKIDAEGAEVPILLRLRRLLAATPIIMVRFYSHDDRRLIDEMLHATHRLAGAAVASPSRGLLTYFGRQPLESGQA